MQDIIIVGAGGFARELRQFVPVSFPSKEFRLKGFLSNNLRDLDPYMLPEPILGDPEDYVPMANDRFLVAIGNVEHPANRPKMNKADHVHRRRWRRM